MRTCKVCVWAALMALCGCGPSDWRADFDRRVKALPELPFDPPGDNPIDNAKPGENNKRLTAVLENAVAFKPNASPLWPGALVQGKSIRSGFLDAIPIDPEDRAPVVLTLVGLEGPAPKRVKVEQPDLGRVTEAVKSLVAANLADGHAQPADAALSVERVYSLEESALRLGASYESMTATMQASFKQQREKRKSSVMVRFTQTYYTVACSAPSTPAAVLNNGRVAVTLAANNRMGDGNPPAYVDSVVYGRQLWMLVSNNLEADKLEASVHASVSGLGSKASVDAGLAENKVLSESLVSAFVLGGGLKDAVGLITAGTGEAVLKTLHDYIQGGAECSKGSPGLPISYQIRYLGSTGPARLSYSTDYKYPSQRNVTGFQVTYETTSQDKDGEPGGADVVAVLRHRNEEVGKAEIGPREARKWWEKGTFHGPFRATKLDKSINEADISDCTIQVTQEDVPPRNGATWDMRVRIEVFFDGADNKPVIVHDYKDPWKGVGQSSFRLDANGQQTGPLPLRRP
jgi:hypothetical protein